MKPLTESGANARDARLSYAPQRVTKAVPAPANERKVCVQEAVNRWLELMQLRSKTKHLSRTVLAHITEHDPCGQA